MRRSGWGQYRSSRLDSAPCWTPRRVRCGSSVRDLRPTCGARRGLSTNESCHSNPRKPNTQAQNRRPSAAGSPVIVQGNVPKLCSVQSGLPYLSHSRTERLSYFYFIIVFFCLPSSLPFLITGSWAKCQWPGQWRAGTRAGCLDGGDAPRGPRCCPLCPLRSLAACAGPRPGATRPGILPCHWLAGSGLRGSPLQPLPAAAVRRGRG